MASAPRLVLDTNGLVSALLFRKGRLGWLRQTWQVGQITPLVCTTTVEELLRVLAYPKFRLDRDDISELLAELMQPAFEPTLYEQLESLPEGLIGGDPERPVACAAASLRPASSRFPRWRRCSLI